MMMQTGNLIWLQVVSSSIPGRKKWAAALVQPKVYCTVGEKDVSPWASPWPTWTLGSSFVQWK